MGTRYSVIHLFMYKSAAHLMVQSLLGEDEIKKYKDTVVDFRNLSLVAVMTLTHITPV